MKKIITALLLIGGAASGLAQEVTKPIEQPIVGANVEMKDGYSMVGLGGRGAFLSANPLGVGLQYSTSPILEQLRIMSTQGNVGEFQTSPIVGEHKPLVSTAMLSGVWDNPQAIRQQQSTYNDALFGGAKPIPQSFVQPMLDAAMLSQQTPYTAAVQESTTAFPHSKGVKPIKEFKFVNAPITNQFETLPIKELPNILQHYSVPSTFTTQENIKQPITQPIWQPYLQRYEQRAVPVVQPIVNRVLQPVIHRQLHPYLTSEVIQGPQQQAIVNAPKVMEFKNEPIVGSELNPMPLEDRSEKPNLPVVAAATATKK